MKETINRRTFYAVNDENSSESKSVYGEIPRTTNEPTTQPTTRSQRRKF